MFIVSLHRLHTVAKLAAGVADPRNALSGAPEHRSGSAASPPHEPHICHGTRLGEEYVEIVTGHAGLLKEQEKKRVDGCGHVGFVEVFGRCDVAECTDSHCEDPGGEAACFGHMMLPFWRMATSRNPTEASPFRTPFVRTRERRTHVVRMVYQ
jgi:hypothetical protein